MKPPIEELRARLAANDHGSLGTVHAERGVDLVPVVYAFDGQHLGVPIDRVKAKASARLGRLRNLEADPRATLLVEHWQRDDWSALWWVRAELRWESDRPDVEHSLATALADRFEQYRDRPFHSVLVFRLVGITGWAAG